MSNTTHTPGPWKFIDASKVASYQYKSLCVIEAGNKQVASFSWNDNSPWFPTRIESQANARLIAAAPDLLAALKMLREIDDAYGFDLNEQQRDQMHDAIAKAGGPLIADDRGTQS
jgi:hypothetical protein